MYKPKLPRTPTMTVDILHLLLSNKRKQKPHTHTAAFQRHLTDVINSGWKHPIRDRETSTKRNPLTKPISSQIRPPQSIRMFLFAFQQEAFAAVETIDNTDDGDVVVAVQQNRFPLFFSCLQRRGPENAWKSRKYTALHNNNGVDDTIVIVNLAGTGVYWLMWRGWESSPPRWQYNTNTTYHRSVRLVRPVWPCKRYPPVQTFSDGHGLR